jgi:hypothetical protein
MAAHLDQAEAGAEMDERTRRLLEASAANVAVLSEAFVSWERAARSGDEAAR